MLRLRSQSQRTPTTSRSESLKKMDPVRIQADTMGFADRFVTAMTGVYDGLERRATTPAARYCPRRKSITSSVRSRITRSR